VWEQLLGAGRIVTAMEKNSRLRLEGDAPGASNGGPAAGASDHPRTREILTLFRSRLVIFSGQPVCVRGDFSEGDGLSMRR